MNALAITTWFAALFASSSLFSHDVALRLILLAAGLVSATTAAVRHRHELRLLPTIWWPFLLWMAWAALSLTWSIEPDRSYREFRNEIVYVALGFLVCYISAQGPRAFRIFVPVLAASVVLLCALAVHSFLLQGFEQYQDGWHGGAGNLSSALLVLFPGVIAAGWYGVRIGSRKALTAALLLTLLIFLAAYTTLNRTIWLGFAIDLVLLGGLIVFRDGSWAKGRIRPLNVILGAAVVAGFALVVVQVQVERQGVDPLASLEKEPRPKVWAEVAERIGDAPLTGYGFGRGLFRQALTDEFRSGLIWHAHNYFLDLALQTGIPGLLLFLLLLGAIVRKGWTAIHSSSDKAKAACGLAVIGMVTGMGVRNMTDTLFVRQNSLFFWAMIGFLLGWMDSRAKA